MDSSAHLPYSILWCLFPFATNLNRSLIQFANTCLMVFCSMFFYFFAHELVLSTGTPNGNIPQVNRLGGDQIWHHGLWSWRCCTGVDARGVFKEVCGARQHCVYGNNGQEFGDFTNSLKYQGRKKKSRISGCFYVEKGSGEKCSDSFKTQTCC